LVFHQHHYFVESMEPDTKRQYLVTAAYENPEKEKDRTERYIEKKMNGKIVTFSKFGDKYIYTIDVDYTFAVDISTYLSKMKSDTKNVIIGLEPMGMVHAFND